MKNIHILTTSKPSRLLNCIEGFRLFEEEVSPDNEWCVNVNTHITSDEEIKEGDPRINNYQRKLKGEEIPSKKIILTTDLQLIADGVQAIPDEFLEWFVKNPSCEGVEIEGYIYKGQDETEYKIIIPKEEQECMITKIMQMDGKMAYDSLLKQGKKMKQETLEESAKIFVNNRFAKQISGDKTYPDIYASKEAIIESHILFAKWQQKRSYSDEDFKLFARQYYREIKLDKSNLLWDDLADKCLEQFKKK